MGLPGPVAELARPWFRTHRYDQRGCGRSDPSNDYRLARFVADLDKLREHFGHDSWDVFGHSFGADLGLRYAAAHPSRVPTLIHCCGRGIGWARNRSTYHDNAAARLSPEQALRRYELDARERTWEEEVEWRTLCWLPDFAEPRRALEMATSTATGPSTPRPQRSHPTTSGRGAHG